MKVELPEDGSVIVFTVKPNGSWARIGEPVRVNHIDDDYIRLTTVREGYGTYDRDYAYRGAVWTVQV